MTTDRRPDFLTLARDWRAAADLLRAAGVAEGDPVLSVWREAACCHVLFARGRHTVAVARLRVVVRDVTGVPPDPAPLPAGPGEATTAAAGLFARLHAAVSARYPGAFRHPAAA